MEQFIRKHGDRLLGVLSGFDRLRFRGTLLLLTSEGGMMEFLWQNGVLLRDFKSYVMGITDRVRRATERLAAQTPEGRVKYLATTRISKEDVARQIAEESGVQEGIIGVLSCVEPCRSFDVRRNRQKKRLELQLAERQCLHHYFYFRHREFGFLHVRLQTWFPFTIHICLNGREWLARQMDRAGIGYVRRDNCFTYIEDIRRAQRLMDRQLRRHWPRLLDMLRRRVHPTHDLIADRCPMDYYWTVNESEWATDLLFRSPSELSRLYPRLLHFGLLSFDSANVMRFLGRNVPAHGGVHGAFQGEVISDVRRRPEGVRIKHRVKQNSIKMYDKQGSVLRVETTLINPKDMKVYRPRQDDPDGPREWRALRKGVADLHRRAQVCQAANARYLGSLAPAEDETTVAELSTSICRRVNRNGRSWRALNPLAADDAKLLEAVYRTEFTVNGFRNRDIRELLYGRGRVTPEMRRRQSAQITRKLTLLRTHGLIKKVSRTHRYVLTTKAQTIIAALLAARQASTKQLTQAA